MSAEDASARASRGEAAGGGARRPPHTGARLAWLTWLGVAVNVAVVLAAKHFPYQDGANHLARYVLLDRAWWGVAPAEVHARLLPTPYIALDVVGAALVHVLGPDLALRAITLAAVVLLPLGMDRLLRHTAPDRRGWALVGVLLSLSWYLMTGLLNFVIGAGLVFFWLAWWWPRRDDGRLATRAAGAAGAVGLFLVHLSAPLSALVVVWVDCAVAWVEWVRSARAGGDRPRVRPRTVTAAVVTAAVLALWASAELTLGRLRGSEGALAFRSVSMKAAALGAPFYAFDARQALLLGAGWAASLAAFLYVNRDSLRLDAIAISAAAFLGLYVASPKSVGLTGGVDVRWLVFAYLLPFCATEATRGRHPPTQWRGLAAALAAVVVHAGAVWRETQRRDRLLAEFDGVLRSVRPESRLLPVVADGVTHGRVGVYDEYAFWHVIRNAGRVPGLYNLNSTRPDEPPFAHFAHFELGVRRYVPPFGWGVDSFGPLDWGQIARDYDYVVQAGADPRVTRYLSDHAQVRRREGAITLYAVGPRP